MVGLAVCKRGDPLRIVQCFSWQGVPRKEPGYKEPGDGCRHTKVTRQMVNGQLVSLSLRFQCFFVPLVCVERLSVMGARCRACIATCPHRNW